MNAVTTTVKARKKAVILGRSAATGCFVLAPVKTKKSAISDQKVTAAVKSVLDRKK